MTIQALGNIGYQDARSSPSRRFMTEAEYWDKYYEYPDMVFEWNNGCLEEKPVSDALTFMTYEWFWELLRHYLRTEPIAKTTGLEMGFNLALPRKKNTVRRPDLGIVLNSNPVPLLPTDKSYNGTYDLCIEAVSDSKKTDITRDTEVKNKEYAKTGVREYYILDGHDRYSGFYRLGAGGVYVPLPAKNGIVKSTVLPGFQFRTEDLYRCPPPVEMIKDPVYQNFVLPGYSTALQKAEEAEQLAVIEASARKKAGQLAVIEASARKKAEQFAKRLAEQLRTLGIEPDDI